MQKGFNPMDEVFFALCKRTDTPVSLSAWLRYKYDRKALLDLEAKPSDYLQEDHHRFALDYAVVSFLSKWKGHDIGVDRAAVALQKFVTSEERCAATNRSLRTSRSKAIDPSVASVLYTARRKISRLLGPLSLHAIEPFFEWGPGATHDISRRRAQFDKKMTHLPISVGPRAAELFDSVVRGDRHWSSALLGVEPSGPFSFIRGTYQLIDTCRVTTVPKSAKTDRTIAIEPTGNLYLQKGVGGFIRKKLKRVGIDLDDQSTNQAFAKAALDSRLATLDLKAASDSVSKELVYELLPLEWANLLDDLRSRRALMPDGDEIYLEKFSSMGNGFTFELESLIFWAICSSVCSKERPFSVYGDDLIVPQENATDVVRVLNFIGFEINDDKSFISGTFFESCGKHYFSGHDVTPPYQKELLDDGLEFFRAHNRLIRWALRVGFDPSVAHPIRRLFPKGEPYFIPYGDESDDGFLVSIEESMARAVDLCRNRGIRVRVVSQRQVVVPGHERAMLSVMLRRMERKPASLAVFSTPSVPTYGDIALAPSLSFVKSFRTTRWVYPQQVSVLPSLSEAKARRLVSDLLSRVRGSSRDGRSMT